VSDLAPDGFPVPRADNAARPGKDGGVGNDPSALIIAVVVVLALGLVLRWVFRPSGPRRGGRPVDAAESPDLGLLTVVGSGLERQEALRRRALLQDAGIRSSSSKRRDGRLDVLVFHADADAARLILDS
jgi:hypothetical protein